MSDQDLARDYADTMEAMCADMVALLDMDTMPCDDPNYMGVVDGEYVDLPESGADPEDVCDVCDQTRADHVLAASRLDGHEDVYEFMAERPLEIVWRIGADFSVLFTFGGPNAYIDAELDSDKDRLRSAELHVGWGGDTVTRRSSDINRVADYYIEMMKESGE